MGEIREGQVFNLNLQNFAGLVALATSPAGELFFAGVLDGIIPLMLYEMESYTVHLGILVSEKDGQVKLLKAVSVRPRQLLAAHEATNYSPRDCLRGLWFDLKKIRPDLLGEIIVPVQAITKRFDLGSGAPDTIS